MPTLDWLNRDAAFQIAKQVPYRLLRFEAHYESTQQNVDTKAEEKQADLIENLGDLPPKSAVFTSQVSIAPTHDNLLIQGDNLEALKALLPLYRGQVKCIFIDPPYNTKSAFEHYDDNLEHAQWLTMMLPRLQLLRELLREDGSIWVTIDDNEGHYLKVLMDEVFGRGNFVANVVWQKRTSADARLRLGAAHDSILVFSKEGAVPQFNLLRPTEIQALNFKNPDNDIRGSWASTDFTAQGWRPNQMYKIVTPNGTEYEPPPGRCWGNVESEFLRLRSENRIWFGAKGDSRPRVKNFLGEIEGMSAWTWWTNKDTGHNQESKKEINELFGAEIAFTTPKPERLLERILQLATQPTDLVLDSFSGSGTTAAVAQKMGRRWIGIEMGEHAATHCIPRLQKVIDGEQGGISKAVNWAGGGSFQFAKLGATIFDESGAISPDVRFRDLAAFIWMQETRTPWPRAKLKAKHDESPLLGIHNGVAIFLLFNGILGDRRPQGGNVLTAPVLAWLKESAPQAFTQNSEMRFVMYGEATRLGPARLANERITFQQIPYDVGRG